MTHLLSILGFIAWINSSVLAEYSTQYSGTTLTWQKSSVYAGSRLLSTITNTAGNEVTEYHHPDRLGTRLISNPVGATQVEQNTLPFGTSIDAETTGTSNQRFTSYDRSYISGLDYAVNRTYNSGQSRFTQVDPIGMGATDIADPQSLNLFAYVQNNPIDFTDPSGLNLQAPPHWIVTIQISWFDRQWEDHWGADNGWTSGGDTGRRTPPDPGDEPAGGEPEDSKFPCPQKAMQIIEAFKKIFNELLQKKSGHRTNSPKENGGWIYQKTNGDIYFRAASNNRRNRNNIDLSNPPREVGARVIATAHTHPYTAEEQNNSLREERSGFGFGTGTHDGDAKIADRNGYPGIVIYEGYVPDSLREWKGDVGSAILASWVGPDVLAQGGCNK